MRAPRRSLALLAAASAVGCEGVLPEPDLERMIEQRSARPYEAWPAFADGRAMRPPPAGTIPRGRALGPAPLVDGGDTFRDLQEVPLAVDRALLLRGRSRFETFCAACHGLEGDGVSAVAHNMELRKPPSLVDARVAAFPAGRIFRVIGGGYGLMPSYAAQLSVRDRWATVAYLRALQLRQGVPLDSLPPELRAEAERALEGASP